MPWTEHTSVNWGHWDLRAWMARFPSESVAAKFGADQQSFDIRFLEDLLARLGDEFDLLAQLGFLYTQTGRYRDGLAVDRRLVALRPRDPTAYYNLACSHSQLKATTRAFAALRRAIELGYRDIEHMQIDPDLENIRKDPRWGDIRAVMHL